MFGIRIIKSFETWHTVTTYNKQDRHPAALDFRKESDRTPILERLRREGRIGQ